MRLGDVIVAHVSSGGMVVDETPPSLDLSQQFAEIDQVEIVQEPTRGDRAPVARVRAWVSEEGEAKARQRLRDVLVGVDLPTFLALPDVGDFIECDGLSALTELRLAIEHAVNSTDRGLRHVLLINVAPVDLERPVLAARNENRLLWMLHRGQSARLRQLRGRVRQTDRELEELQGARDQAVGQATALGAKVERLTEALEQARRSIKDERERANRVEQARFSLELELEKVKRLAAEATRVAKAARGAVSFRMGRAVKVAAQQATKNPLLVPGALKRGFAGPDEVLGRLEED